MAACERARRRCRRPGWSLTRVLDDAGSAIGAELEHFYSREHKAIQEVWLVCRSCHLRIGDRVRFAAAFEAYQQRAEQLEASQIALFT
jgi:hypothetical protein